MKISKTGSAKTTLIDNKGKEYAYIPNDWLLGRDIKSAPMYFYVSPNGSNGGGVVIDWATVTHLIKDGVETPWVGSGDALFTELGANFFKEVSGSGSTINASLYDYVIEKLGGVYRSTGRSGNFQHANATTVFNLTMGALVTGGQILVKGSIEDLDIMVVPHDNITISGEGRFVTSLKLKAKADLFYNPAARKLKGMFEVHGINNFKIKSIEMNGNGQKQEHINDGNQKDGPGCLSAVYAGNQHENSKRSNSTVVDDCYIHSFTMYGVYTNINSYGANVKNCLITDCYWNGITTLGNDETFEDVVTYGSGDVGISLYGQRTKLIRCSVGAQNGAYSSVASRWGIAIEQSDIASKGHSIIDCTIDGGVAFDINRAFAAQKSEDVKIQNLKVRNVKEHGFYVEGCKDFTIINSDIKSTSTAFTQGIVVTDLDGSKSNNVRIITCDIKFNGFAINITAGAEKTVVMNNTLSSGSEDLKDAGAGTIKSNNYSFKANAFLP